MPKIFMSVSVMAIIQCKEPDQRVFAVLWPSLKAPVEQCVFSVFLRQIISTTGQTRKNREGMYKTSNREEQDTL